VVLFAVLPALHDVAIIIIIQKRDASRDITLVIQLIDLSKRQFLILNVVVKKIVQKY